MDNTYSLQNIHEMTGLQIDFLRKVYKTNLAYFKPHTRRGNKNSILFNSSALTLFDQIKQQKENGATLPEISEFLKVSFKQTGETVKTNRQNSQQNRVEEVNKNELLDRLEGAYKVALEAKEQLLTHQGKTIQQLEQKLLLLTDGKDPEAYRQAQLSKQLEEAQEKERLKREALEAAQKLQEKEKALETLQQEVQKKNMTLAQELAEQKEKEAAKQAEKDKIIAELGQLGWFQGKRKKELLKQLAEL
ncbi:MAG: hypothetical protein AB7F43_14545 [Bacteriovoracia bacterium]